MKRRLAGFVALLVSLAASISYLGYWIGPSASSILAVKHAEYVLVPPSAGAMSTEPVRLPHLWPASDPPRGTIGIYRITLPAHDAHERWAVSVANYMPETEVVVAGKVLPWESLTGHLGQTAFARLGALDGGQSIEFRVPQHFSLHGGLGEIQAGPEELLERRAWVISLMRDIGHIWSAGMALAVCVVSFGAYWFRRESFLLALSYGAFAFSLRLALPYIGGYWDDDGVELALYLWASLNTIAGLSFLVLLTTHQKTGYLVPAVTICLIAIALILFAQIGPLEFRRSLSIGFALVIIWIAFLRSWRQLVLERHWILLAIVTLGLIRVSTALASAIEHHGQFGYADVNNQIVITPVAILAAILIGARHLYEAFRNYEMANGQLRQEVDAYKAELASSAEREKALAVDQAAATERFHWMQEIHDGIGSHLIAARFIADKATDARDLQNVKNAIDDGIEELRELVESLSPGQSTVPSILGAMRYRMKARFESAGIKMRWDVDPMIESAEISARQALNVQRITQEALSNVLKHSQAKLVSIHIFTRGKSIIVRVEDDGRGFAPDKTRSGRGLGNMRKRAGECNGEITWTNMDPGLRVELSLPNA